MSVNLGYEGQCTRCNEKIRAYYVFADGRRKEMMRKGTFMFENSNCPKCVTNSLIPSAHTIKWQRQLSDKEVQSDLRREIEHGVKIDFDAAEKQMKENEANDKWLENNEKRVAEKLAWLKKTEGGIQKYQH